MLPITPIRLGPYARSVAENNEALELALIRRAREAQLQRAIDTPLVSRPKAEPMIGPNPLPGWPKPRPQPDEIPIDATGSVGGQGGPFQTGSPQEAAAAELERRRAARETGGQGASSLRPSTPQEAARAELERRRNSKPQLDNIPLTIYEEPAPTNRPLTALEELRGERDPKQDAIARAWAANPPEMEPMRPSQLQALAGNFANTMTFGNAPRIAALPALFPGGETYPEAVESQKDKLRATREDYPVTSTVGDVAGFLAPGTAVAKGVNLLTQGAVQAAQRASPILGFLAKSAQAGLTGAGAGGLYGGTVGAENAALGQSEDGVVVSTAPPGAPSLETRLETAASYAPFGAAFGAAAPTVGAALRTAGRWVSGKIAELGELTKLAPGAVERFNQRVGVEAARRDLERAGILTVEDFLKRAAKYGDKPVVTGELGQSTLNSLVSLVRGKGTTADKAMAVLEDRVSGLPGRMLKDIADETGMKPEEVFGSLENMVKASLARAAPAYEAAEAAPFAETANLERIVRDSPALRSLMPTAVNRVQNQAVERIGQAEQMPPLKVYDELKQLLDEQINARIAKGEGIADLEGLRKVLVAELDEISAEGADYLARLTNEPFNITAPGASPYARAREAGGDAPKIRAGLKSGERALSGAKLADDVAREVAAIRGGELTAYQAGVIRNLVREVENGRLTPRRIKTMAFRTKLNEVFGEPAAQGLIRKFGIESELQVKGARWNPNVGSVTSQAQMGGPSKLGDEIVRGAANVMTGNKVGLVTQVVNALRRQGYSEPQLNAIGDILLSAPEEAAKRLFPGQTPKPGSIPPPVPPAGRIRENTTVTPPANLYGRASNNLLASPVARDVAGGAAGATFGAATTPEGENPLTRAGTYGAAGAALAHGIGSWARAPVGKTQLNAFFPEPVGFRGGRPGRNPVGRKEDFEPRDLILAKNDNDGSYLDIGLSLGLDPNAVNVSSTINLLIQRVRTTIDRAAKVNGLDDLAKQWNVTRDELEKFQVRQQKSPFAGQTEAALSKAADIMETAAKNKQSISYDTVAQRLQAAGFKMTAGSLRSLMSAARTGASRGHSFSDALRDRIRALPAQPAGRPYYTNSPPELGGAVIGGMTGASAPADNPTDRVRNMLIGGLGGAAAGRLSRSVKPPPGVRQQSAIPLGSRPRLADVLPDDLIEDATQENLRAVQQKYIAAGQAPPVFKTFRMPDGRIVAWRSDGDFRGGMSHDQARDVLGLGNTRMEHGQFKYGDDLGKTNWYGTSGEGPAPRRLESMMKSGMKEGRDPNDVLLDATPDEVLRDLRSIGAEGPGTKIGDYPYRRKLAMDTEQTELGAVWETPSGKQADLHMLGDDEAMVGFAIDGSSARPLKGERMPVSESKETFEKAFAVIEREAIRKGKDAYFFYGASQSHNRLYLGALQRLGAPQGYVAIYNRDVGSFALMRPRYLDNLIAEGKVRPGEWTIIKSKRGDTPVPEWRRRTGQFAIPPVTALSMAGPPKKEAAPTR